MPVFCKYIAFFIVVGTATVPVSNTRVLSAEQYFFSVIEDLPVMPQLIEDIDAAMSFETSAGRVAEVEAKGLIAVDKVGAYYNESLPQLGWKPKGNGNFRRGNELLAVEVKNTSSGTVKVLFHLKPASQ